MVNESFELPNQNEISPSDEVSEDTGGNPLTRRDFLKLAAAGAATTAVLAGCAPLWTGNSVENATTPTPESNSIPEFVDLKEPLPYTTEDFATDKLGILQEGWKNNPWSVSSNIPYDLRDYEMTDAQRAWLEFARIEIPPVEKVPSGVLNTPPP